MNWEISFHNRVLKFLKTNNIPLTEIKEIITKTIKRLQGEDINIDIAKLKGKWTGFFRIKTGKIRIIAEFDFDHKKVYIEAIDWRGNIYK